jgi:hypothetical protein
MGEVFHGDHLVYLPDGPGHWLHEGGSTGLPQGLKKKIRWEKMRLNMPTTPTYEPIIPWISKRRSDRVLATDIFTYMDDMRPLAPSKVEF